MTDKTLYIHAGGPKTGSSALQNVFEKYHSQLKAFDFAYENRFMPVDDFEINSGNGLWLYEALSSPTRVEARIDETVLRYFGECNSAICSTEFFSMLDSSSWKDLYRSSLRLGVELRIIFYVRNAMPLLMSGYDQAVKRHGETSAFEDWALTAEWDHVRALGMIAKEIPISNLIVLSYDRNEADLIQSFFTAVSLDSKLRLSPEDLKRRVNRSLTADEREILIALNRSIRGTHSAELAKLLIYENPTVVSEPPSIGDKITKKFLERFGRNANWLNTTFFQGKPVVSVLPIRTGETDQLKAVDRSQDLQRIALSWVIEKLRTIRTETIIEILDAVSDAAMTQYKMDRSGIPVDFDPIAYLALNPDVADAGMDPFQHFADHGNAEGRLFKFAGERAEASFKQEITELHCRIEAMKELLKQSAVNSKTGLRRAIIRERELSAKLELQLIRNKTRNFFNWFR